MPNLVGPQRIARMISVIVCTCNRAARLERTLQSLAAMKVPTGFQWELIIVDNNSTDDTTQIIDHYQSTSDLPIRSCFEKHQGLAYARNRGIQESSGTIIAFTDDDCLVDPSWLTSISQEFALDPSASGVCGRVELYNKEDKPVSIRTYLQKTVFSSPTHLFNLVMGSNMSFLRRVFDEVGLFDTDFGPGTTLGSADDSDFFYRVYKNGLKIIYCPNILVYHNHGRRDEIQLNALFKDYARGRGGFYCKHIFMGDTAILKSASYTLMSHGRSIIKGFVTGGVIDRHKIAFISIIEGFLYKLIIANFLGKIRRYQLRRRHTQKKSRSNIRKGKIRSTDI